MKLLFCNLGLHWRMKLGEHLFTDIVSGRAVYSATCPCGRKWMVDTAHGFPSFKVEREIK
jgi:hypothetical protein